MLNYFWECAWAITVRPGLLCMNTRWNMNRCRSTSVPRPQAKYLTFLFKRILRMGSESAGFGRAGFGIFYQTKGGKSQSRVRVKNYWSEESVLCASYLWSPMKWASQTSSDRTKTSLHAHFESNLPLDCNLTLNFEVFLLEQKKWFYVWMKVKLCSQINPPRWMQRKRDVYADGR